MGDLGKHPSSDEEAVRLEDVWKISRTISSFSVTVAAVGFAVSFFYNWGFLSALGSSFDTAPMSITDFAISWAAWLPGCTVMGFFLFVLEFWSSRKKGLGTNAGQNKPDMTQEFEKKSSRITRVFCLFIITTGLFFVVLYLIDIHRPSLLLALGFSCFWFAIAIWVFSFPRQKDRYRKVARDLITFIPIVAFFAFSFGCSKVNSTYFGQHDIYKIYFKNEKAATSQSMEVQVIRTFEKWMVILNEDRKVGWIRLDRVERFDLEKNVLSF